MYTYVAMYRNSTRESTESWDYKRYKFGMIVIQIVNKLVKIWLITLNVCIRFFNKWYLLYIGT